MIIQVKLSESIAARRRLPIRLLSSVDAELAGLTIVPATDIKISKNGSVSAAADAGGTWGEVGEGDYYWEPVAVELNTLGFFRYRVLVGASKVYDGLAQVIPHPYLDLSRGIGGFTVAAGASTSVIPTTLLSPSPAVLNQFINATIIFDNATLTPALGLQRARITGVSVGGVLTVTPALLTTPAPDDSGIIV